MYAHVMRKWSLIKLLMLLFLPIMILLFYCQGGVNAMYLSAPRQQNQQQLHYNAYYTPHQNTHNFQGVEEKRFYNNENSNRFLSESNNNNNNIYNRKVDNHDSKNGNEMDDDSGEEEKQKNLLLTQSDRNIIRSDNNLSNINKNSNSYVNEYSIHENQKQLWIKRMEEKRDRHENFRHMHSRIAASSSLPSPLSSSSSSLSPSIINQTEYENLNSISSHDSSASNRHISNNLNINSSSYRNRRDSPSRSNTTNNNSNNTNKNKNNNNNNNNNKSKRIRNKNKLHIKRHTNKSKRRRSRRNCSARDPSTLAFVAPTVFSGKIHSMSSERSSNFSVSFEIVKIFKKQNGFTLPPVSDDKQLVRLQFTKGNKIECDIFKEDFRTIGIINQDFQQRKIYYLFVNQTNSGNFTILGQPIEDNETVTVAINKGIKETYGQNATIVDLRYETKNKHSTRDLQIDANTKIRLVCKVKGRPTPKVTWYFKKRSIRGLPGYTVETSRRRSVLTIKHAQVQNSGDYECRARNKLTKRASRTIKIRVTEERGNSPKEEISPPKPCYIPDYCYNHGSCQLLTDINELTCHCHEGYTGLRCELKLPTEDSYSNNNNNDDRPMPMKQMETSIPNDYYAEDVK